MAPPLLNSVRRSAALISMIVLQMHMQPEQQ